jgi:hypothetical protein
MTTKQRGYEPKFYLSPRDRFLTPQEEAEVWKKVYSSSCQYPRPLFTPSQEFYPVWKEVKKQLQKEISGQREKLVEYFNKQEAEGKKKRNERLQQLEEESKRTL